jgi:hypothetical protein
MKFQKRCCEFRFNGKAFNRFATRQLNLKSNDLALIDLLTLAAAGRAR